MTYIKQSIAFLAAAVLVVAAGCASSNDLRKENAMATSTVTIVQPPATHVEVVRRPVRVDGKDATLTRYERRDRRNASLGGEHFSTLVDCGGRLKGFTNVSMELVGTVLPSRERTEQIARAFLQESAPDLLPRMKISWIEPHNEPIETIGDGGVRTTVALTGMKMKARNLADGRWFWVIVGGDAKPMVFERDILWVTFPGHRKTEKWLHDGWMREREGDVEVVANKSTASL